MELMQYLAKLSRLEINDQELRILQKEMEDIMRLMDQVKDFPDAYESERIDPVVFGDLRFEAVSESLESSELLKNASKQQDGYFVVPKMV